MIFESSGTIAALLSATVSPVYAFNPLLAHGSPTPPSAFLRSYPHMDETLKPSSSIASVAYKSFNLPLNNFGVEVPLASWFPKEAHNAKSEPTESISRKISYDYRISLRKIGQLLAGWDFIPGLVSRDFALAPSGNYVIDGSNESIPRKRPIILLAHGFLGSRFDLSHLAEALAAEGFVYVAPEYPESLAASYDDVEGLDRAAINDSLIKYFEKEMEISSKQFGIIGHSLGCFTALTTGDDSWARVCISGFPRSRDGRVIHGKFLFVTSMNDGAVSPARFGGAQGIPTDIELLDQNDVLKSTQRLPSRAAILYDKPDAPNHISFLAESVNDAMIDFLSLLIPLAKAFNIPLLDFDRYQVSRDSLKTAEMVHPVILRYMKQEMQVNE